MDSISGELVDLMTGKIVVVEWNDLEFCLIYAKPLGGFLRFFAHEQTLFDAQFVDEFKEQFVQEFELFLLKG